LSAPKIGHSRWSMPDPNRKILSKSIKHEKVGDDEATRADSSDIMRSITPFEKKEEEVGESPKKVLTEKEKLNDPIVIAKGGRRAIRHETLERDNDLH
jgi:hypothetical protein